MTTKLPSREVTQRLAEAAASYRAAFVHVQDELEKTDLGRVPGWVFAIDRLPLEEVREMSVSLAEAEERRRAWRTALQSLVEHVALDDAEDDAQPGAVQGDKAHLRKLDRFITVVNFAKAGGCIYIDGVFEPVNARPTNEGTKDDEAHPRAVPDADRPLPTSGLPKA